MCIIAKGGDTVRVQLPQTYITAKEQSIAKCQIICMYVPLHRQDILGRK